VTPFAPALAAAVVDKGIHIVTDAVVAVAQDQIIAAVAIEIENGPGTGTIGGQFGIFELPQRILIYAGRWHFQTALTVAEDEIEITLLRKVVLVDALQDTSARDVEVVPGLTADAGAECLKPSCCPNMCHLQSPVPRKPILRMIDRQDNQHD